MPTAARLMAAFCLAVLGYVVGQMVKPLMPESTDFGYFDYVNIVIGLLVGWIVMGRRAGRGGVSAINNGLTGAAVLMFWGIAVQSANEMLRLAMRNRYDGAFEAIAQIFQIGAEYALVIATVPIGITLLIGAVLSGMLTEFAASRWR
ncbi:MAG: TrgA family protein [Sulfitobacter sp.]|nr:TrgA family protein [Sulfitobacter sp.]